MRKILVTSVLVLIGLFVFTKPNIKSSYIPYDWEDTQMVRYTVTLIEYRLPYSWGFIGQLGPSSSGCSGKGCVPKWIYYDIEIERNCWAVCD